MYFNQLFLISTNEMLSKTLDIWSKPKIFSLFTIDNLEEARHFFDDMKPDFLLVDCDDLSEDSVKEFIGNTHESIPVVLINGTFLETNISKPIELESFEDQLNGFYNKFHNKKEA